MRWILALGSALLLAGCTGAERTADSVPPEATAGQTAAVKASARPEFVEVTLPAGTTLALDLQSGVSSETSQVEDAVRASLRTAIVIDDKEVLPVGTELAGTVISADRSARVKGRARVAFRFNSLRHDGTDYDIRTAAISREARATKGSDAKKIGIGAGIGAAIGGILGGGDGAAKGAAVGGGAGTGVVLSTRGKEIALGPGAHVTTRLMEPVTVRLRRR